MKTSSTNRIAPFAAWGRRLVQQLHDGALDQPIAEACRINPWFTTDGCHHAIEAVCNDLLGEKQLAEWVTRYTFSETYQPLNTGIVMAGNLPLVGLADLLYVGVCGDRPIVKCSSKDATLMRYAIDQLHVVAPQCVVEELTDQTSVDRLIATGSNHTAEYFSHYGATIPTLTRGSRTSLALLTGDESDEQLKALSEDIFLYFGLGCRNVSRLLVPQHYDLERLVQRLQQWPMHHAGYRNNYLQRRAERLSSGEAVVDGGFFLLVPEDDLTLQTAHPISEIGLIRYRTLDEARQLLHTMDSHLQCVVASVACHPRQVGFGQAQHPTADDYADGVDVMDFLLHRFPANRQGTTLRLK